MQTAATPQNQDQLLQAIHDIKEVIRLFQSVLLEHSRNGLEVNAQGGLVLAVGHQFSAVIVNDLGELLRRHNFYLGEIQKEVQKKAGTITIHLADILRWLNSGIDVLSAMWPDEWDEELYGPLFSLGDRDEAWLGWDHSLPLKIITMLDRVNYHLEKFCRQAKKQMKQSERLEQVSAHPQNGLGGQKDSVEAAPDARSQNPAKTVDSAINRKRPGTKKDPRVQARNQKFRELKFDQLDDEQRAAIFKQWDQDKVCLDDPWLKNCRRWGSSAKPSWMTAWSFKNTNKNLRKLIDRAFPVNGRSTL